MRFGFIVADRGQGVEFRLFGQRPAGRVPLVTLARRDGCCLALMGRLYYRSELAERLGEPADSAANPDADPALAAYRRWGAEGLTRLEGDFALVLYDPAEDLLLAVRDPSGGYPLFWTEQAGRVAVATSLPLLAAQRDGCELNRDYLAEFLMLPAPAFQEVPSEESVYCGIRRLRPGMLLSARLSTGQVTRQIYWNWPERIETPLSFDLEPLAEELGHRLRQAVRERCRRGGVAAHFSGGMDSTGVALLARECLLEEGSGPVHALALVYEKLSSLNKETAYIEVALRGQPGVVLHRVAGDELLDFDIFSRPPEHDEPYAGLRGLACDRGLAEAAADAGADTVLTGVGADDLVDVLPHYITDLCRRGRLGAAWREARRWARATNGSPWRLLCRFGLNSLLPPWLRGGLGPLLRGGSAGPQNMGEGTVAPWIRPEFARRHEMRARGVAAFRRIYRSNRSVSVSMAAAALTALSGDGPRWMFAAPHGMALAHPFLDTRVARLGLAIQAGFRPEPGKQKPLLVRAFRDVLPPEILERRRKGHFNEVYFLGLSRNLTALETMIAEAPLDDLGLLDRTVLVRHLRQAALGIERGAAGAVRLDITLALAKWLTMHRQWFSAPLETPAETATIVRPGSERSVA